MWLLYVLAGCCLLFLLSLSPPGANFRRWMMAKLYPIALKRFEPYVAERKKVLFANLGGTVLEIGPGIGANFAHLPDTVDQWIGIEPNPHMHAELRAAGARRGIAAEFRSVSTEGMAIDDESVDVVLSTLVLCSVPDPDVVVREIHRILKPGGRFVFLEHVAAPPGTRQRRLQRWVRPVWRYFADGCCPDRELGDTIKRGGFAEVEMDEFAVPKNIVPAFVSPHVSGVAVK